MIPAAVIGSVADLILALIALFRHEPIDVFRKKFANDEKEFDRALRDHDTTTLARLISKYKLPA